jgi:integrase
VLQKAGSRRAPRLEDVLTEYAVYAQRNATNTVELVGITFKHARAAFARVERPIARDFTLWFSQSARPLGPYAPGTVNAWRSHLLAAYTYFFHSGIGQPGERNELAFTQPLPDHRPRPDTFGDVRAAFAKSVAVMPDARARALIAVLRFQGLRISEVLGLQARDFDTRLWKMWVRRRREVNFWHPQGQPLKHRKHEARMHVMQGARPYILELLALPEAQRHRGCGNGPLVATPYLFPYTGHQLYGDHATPSLAKRRTGKLHRVSEPSIIERMRVVFPALEDNAEAFHVWRHSMAVEAIQRLQGPSALVRLMNLLRHASVTSTARYVALLTGKEIGAEDVQEIEEWQSEDPGAGKASGPPPVSASENTDESEGRHAPDVVLQAAEVLRVIGAKYGRRLNKRHRDKKRLRGHKK